MEKTLTSYDYEYRYNRHVEIITHLQALILIQEKKLFKLIRKKQVEALKQNLGIGLNTTLSLSRDRGSSIIAMGP